MEGAIERDAFDRIVAETYAGFTHNAVAPLVQLGTNEYLMELFHGPTLAFKDYALQLFGRLFDHVLEIRGERMTVLGRPPAIPALLPLKPAGIGIGWIFLFCIPKAGFPMCSAVR